MLRKGLWWLSASVGLSSIASLTAYSLHLNFAAAGFVQLFVVLLIALRAGFAVATVVSIIANLSLDYFFLTPLFTLRVDNPQNWVALAVFELSALLVSRLSARTSEQTRIAQRHQSESERLYSFASALLLITPERSPADQILTLLRRHFGIRSGIILQLPDAAGAATGKPDEALHAATQAAYLSESGLNYADGDRWVRLLRIGMKSIGALGVAGPQIDKLSIDAIASLAALAIERMRSLERESKAQAEREVERLRRTVLDALAHEYKTPLTTIRTVASGLMEPGQSSPEQRDLLSLIDASVVHLNELTTKLLQMSRLDCAPCRLNKERIHMDEVVQVALANTRRSIQGRRVQVRCEEENLTVIADPELITMAVTQYLDNASKYSPPQSTITVNVSSGDGEAKIAVHNNGPYIEPPDRTKIFERSFRTRVAEQMAPGSGIGLSIVQRVAEMHHGRAWVASDVGEGNTFYLAVPAIKG